MRDTAPVIILGAARSGTKLLRRIVAGASEFQEVPHDVNYVWRYGDPSAENDVISPDAATPGAKRFIDSQLRRMARLGRQPRCAFVEKTVSNALRVPYVNACLPNARFIHLVRDGFEVTQSAMRCWCAPAEPGRLLSKLRGFPWRSCGGYALSQGRDWMRRYLGAERRLRSWGPRYPGIDGDVQSRSLAEVCALQWLSCVERARDGLARIDESRWIEVAYEDLLDDPRTTGERIGVFLHTEDPREIASQATQSVNPSAINLSNKLSETESQAVKEILGRSIGVRVAAAA